MAKTTGTQEQIFSARFDEFLSLGTVVSMIAFLIGIPLLWYFGGSDYVLQTNIPVQQPVQFSHRHHVTQMKLDCRYCHNGVETTAFAGVPATSVCMTCHSQLFTDSKILKPIRDSYANGNAMQWNRVHNLPDYVYFNHSIHVNKGVGCVSCHGRVDQMALVKQAKPLTMGWCLDCHRNPGPNLRPADKVYDLGWRRPAQPALDKQLMHDYHIRTKGLTDCSVCHR